jgi:hypothetical protein
MNLKYSTAARLELGRYATAITIRRASDLHEGLRLTGSTS